MWAHAATVGWRSGAGTPGAVVQRATMPDQREAVTTLGELAATIAREQLGSPAVIVVGDVVRGVAAVRPEHPRQVRAA